jgi:hypothetical protein
VLDDMLKNDGASTARALRRSCSSLHNPNTSHKNRKIDPAARTAYQERLGHRVAGGCTAAAQSSLSCTITIDARISVGSINGNNSASTNNPCHIHNRARAFSRNRDINSPTITRRAI